jgi:hypothetical protein
MLTNKKRITAPNKQMCPAGNRKYRVLPIVLNTGETLPTLVRRSNWIPVRVATRWAVRRRRFECMGFRLAHDLRALALPYEWAETALRCDLDDLLETFVVPVGRQLELLVTFLRVKANRVSSNSFNRFPTVANQALAIRSFLMWAADPANQGSAGAKCTKQIAEERAMLIEMFRPFARYTGAAQRIPPLSQPDLDHVVQQQKGEELAENWVAEAEATLNGVQGILEAASAEPSTTSRPFKGKGSHFEVVEQNRG